MSKVKLILLVLMSIWLLFVAQVSHGRYAAIMIDANNGKVLHEVDATQSWYPASLTKVMTLYMAFEALKTGRIHFFDVMSTSSHAAHQPTSKLGLRAGEYLTVRDAILAIITRSANDAAVVLAEHLGGSEENFAVRMTNRARSLGMHNTRFMNATGLPHNWQVTTSRDMAVLAWKIQRHFPEYYRHFAVHSFNYKGTELRATNKFVSHYPGAEGMKTGFTCGSGYNLIASAQQNGKRLIGVVLGGMTSAERYQLMYQMMDAGFDNRFSDDQDLHVNSMPSSVAGAPPYQLSCGHRASLHPASLYTSRSYRSTGRQKFIGRSQKFGKKLGRTGGMSKRVLRAGKSHKTARKITLSKRKSIVTRSSRTTVSKRINKYSRNTQVKKIISRPTTSKHKTVTRSLKSSRTRYRHSNAKN